jgi:hypothetical protein
LTRSYDKPGLHDGHNDPTYVNGKAWKPVWGDPAHRRAEDKSKIYPLPIGSRRYTVEVMAISDRRGDYKMNPREPMKFMSEKGEQVVVIRDIPNGAQWYRFKLKVTSNP